MTEGDAALHTGRIVPIYEAAGKVTTRAFRIVDPSGAESLEPVEDHLPQAIREQLKLPDRWTAIRRTAFSRRRTPTCGC